MLKDSAKLISRTLIAGGVVALALIGFWILDKLLAYRLSRSYVEKIADVFDLNIHLAEALTIILAVILVGASGLAFSFNRQRRFLGIGAMVGLLVINSLVLWYGTRGQFVDREGRSLKCFFFNGDKVVYGEHPGKNPETGRECRPVTPEILWRLREYETGRKPKVIVQSDVVFFDQRSGDPVVWYALTRDKKIQLFDLMGFDPETGAELQPVTTEVITAWQRQRIEEKKAASAARQIDPSKAQFFNPRTGEPQIWYWRATDGRFEFFDSDGFHPVTGDKLLPVSKDIVLEWQKLRSEIERQQQVDEAKRKQTEEQERIRLDQERRAQAEADRIAQEQRERETARAEEEKRRSQRSPQDQLKEHGLDLLGVFAKKLQQQIEQGGGLPNGNAINAGYWEHNGSTVSLQADGNSRRFYYQLPREGLKSTGVHQGTMLFEGQIRGDSYSGVAYIFSSACAPAGYRVSGPVSNGSRTVTLRGQAPIQDENCITRSYRDDVLVFNYHD